MYDPAYTGRAGLLDRTDPMPHDHAPSIDAATDRIMAAAFDAAWASVKASGARFAGSDAANKARKIIADAISQGVRHGERDQSKLRDIALLELARNGRTISGMRGRTNRAGD